jgi:predicted nucleic acid-binding Zn ribbon protein
MVDAKAIKEKIGKQFNKTKAKITPNLPAHKHCRMCGIDIHIKSDPRICNNQECIADLEKQERNDKMRSIRFGVFFIAFVIPIVLRLFSIN